MKVRTAINSNISLNYRTTIFLITLKGSAVTDNLKVEVEFNIPPHTVLVIVEADLRYTLLSQLL